MIAVESFKKFKRKDIIAILSLAIVYLAIDSLIKNFTPQTAYILSLLTLTVLMSSIIHLVRKAGSATLFYLISSILTYQSINLGINGINKIIILTFIGILFELIYLILKLEFKNLQLDIILGTAISTMLLPLIISLSFSVYSTFSLFSQLLNLMLLSFFIGALASVISFLLWYELRTKKFIIKFEYN
jgi:hypothetical protein